MRRREFLGLVGGAAAAWPIAAQAQLQGKVPKIGVLSAGDPGTLLRYLREGLRERGYVEGRTFKIEARSGPGRLLRLRPLADELVQLNVDVIVTRLTPAAQAAKVATQTIPIVMAPAGAPVETGLISSISRPGGNITGLTTTSIDLGGKRLQLMQEIVPSLRRIAILANAADPFTKPFIAEAARAAQMLGLQIDPVPVKGSEEFETAFATMVNRRADAVYMQSSLPAKPAIALALKHKLPMFSSARAVVAAGALMSYGGRRSDAYRGAPDYVDRILRGAKPADLPVQQPTRFELVINLKTATALGLAVPPPILARADVVIE
jgi:putative ABC transport system substrate-binding protein